MAKTKEIKRETVTRIAFKAMKERVDSGLLLFDKFYTNKGRGNGREWMQKRRE